MTPCVSCIKDSLQPNWPLEEVQDERGLSLTRPGGADSQRESERAREKGSAACN